MFTLNTLQPFTCFVTGKVRTAQAALAVEHWCRRRRRRRRTRSRSGGQFIRNKWHCQLILIHCITIRVTVTVRSSLRTLPLFDCCASSRLLVTIVCLTLRLMGKAIQISPFAGSKSKACTMNSHFHTIPSRGTQYWLNAFARLRPRSGYDGGRVLLNVVTMLPTYFPNHGNMLAKPNRSKRSDSICMRTHMHTKLYVTIL